MRSHALLLAAIIALFASPVVHTAPADDSAAGTDAKPLLAEKGKVLLTFFTKQ